MSTSSGPSLPVVLTTQTPYPLPSQKFMIPVSWRRYQLSQLVNKALSLPKPIPFDFIVRGEILRSTLGEWCAENGVGEEETLEIEYIESVLPPEKVSDFPHEEWVSSVSTSIPGHFMTASYDGSLRAFSYSSSKSPTLSAQLHNAPITSFCIANSDEVGEEGEYTVATASHDLTAQLTRIRVGSGEGTSKPLATLHLHTAPLSSIAASPRGTHILTASWDGLIGLWDTTIPASDEVPEHDLAPGDRKSSKRRRVDDAMEKSKRKAPREVLKSHVGRVSGVVYSKEGEAYSCGFDSTVRVWDAEQALCTHTITASSKPFLGLELAPASTPYCVLAISTDRTLSLYDTRIPSTSGVTPSAPLTFTHPSTPSSVSSSPEPSSHQVVTGAYDGVARIWDLRSTKSAVAIFKPWESSGDVKKILSVHWGTTREAGKGVVVVGGEGGMSVWRVAEGQS
ncbi:hypothetical protein H0H92_010367 [Tricholoma furcatifolium]|nr:hypothetical protein H0H92_010367 [Tricholoma furcatifolium]